LKLEAGQHDEFLEHIALDGMPPLVERLSQILE
jgi:hypothetical protein